MSVEAPMNQVNMAPTADQAGMGLRINFLDPTVLFGEGAPSMPMLGSVAAERQADGSYGFQAGEIDDAIGFSVNALRPQAVEQPIGYDADPADPLAMTEREAAIVAIWKEREARAPEAAAAPAETENDQAFLTTPLGRVTVAAGAGLATIFANAAPVMAQTQPNQIPVPAAKVAQPFELSSSGSSLTASASEAGSTASQDCVDAAVAKPGITNTQLLHAGVPETQKAYAHVINEALSSDCDSVIRVESFKFKVQDALHRTRMVSFEPVWFSFFVGNNAGVAYPSLMVGHQGHGLYECSPGSKTTRAEVDIKVAAKDAQTHDTLAAKIYKAPMQKIFPHKC